MGIGFSRNSDFVEKRRARRSPVSLESSVRERSRSALSARVADLSPHGCRIDSLTLALAGNQLWVRLPGLESVIGTVAWSDLTSAGIKFDQPLHPAVAARYVPDQTANQPANDVVETSGNVVHFSPLLSRREQIVAGQADQNLSPLSRQKNASGGGFQRMISRTVQRRVDSRAEPRHADRALTGPMELTIDGKPARIADLSSSGLRIAAPIHADIGKSLSVEFAGFDPIEARLVWAGAGEAGLSLPTGALDLEG